MLVLRSRASRTPFFYIYILVKWGPNLNEKRAYTDKRNKPPFPSVDFRVKKVGFPRMFNKSSLIDRCANSHLFSVPARRSKWTRIVPSFQNLHPVCFISLLLLLILTFLPSNLTELNPNPKRQDPNHQSINNSSFTSIS